MQRPGAVLLRFSPVLFLVATLTLAAQKSGGATGAGSGTGSRPASPPRVPTTNYPVDSTGTPIGSADSVYNFPSPSGTPVDPMLARLLRQERQKQVVRDTDRLVRLTSEYQAEVKASGANGPSAITEKHLKEIEKLAHEVRTTLAQ